jgi:hypothetical protein
LSQALSTPREAAFFSAQIATKPSFAMAGRASRLRPAFHRNPTSFHAPCGLLTSLNQVRFPPALGALLGDVFAAQQTTYVISIRKYRNG